MSAQRKARSHHISQTSLAPQADNESLASKGLNIAYNLTAGLLRFTPLVYAWGHANNDSALLRADGACPDQGPAEVDTMMAVPRLVLLDELEYIKVIYVCYVTLTVYDCLYDPLVYV